MSVGVLRPMRQNNYLIMSVFCGFATYPATGQCPADSTLFLAYRVRFDKPINRRQNADRPTRQRTWLVTFDSLGLSVSASLGLLGYVRCLSALQGPLTSDRHHAIRPERHPNKGKGAKV